MRIILFSLFLSMPAISHADKCEDAQKAENAAKKACSDAKDKHFKYPDDKDAAAASATACIKQIGATLARQNACEPLPTAK